MEYSYQFSETMQAMALRGNMYAIINSSSLQTCTSFPLFLCFTIDRAGCEIPKCVYDEAQRLMRRFAYPIKVAMALTVEPYAIYNRVTGGESAIKTLSRYGSRGSSGRMCAITVTKGEKYYGGNGIILDKDFDPLLLSTVYVRYLDSGPSIDADRGVLVHIHSKVFTEGDRSINKVLQKKGITYYLERGSANPNDWRRGIPIKVILDDSKDFFKKVEKPNPATFSTTNLSKLVKDNIDEVLNQIVSDRAVVV